MLRSPKQQSGHRAQLDRRPGQSAPLGAELDAARATCSRCRRLSVGHQQDQIHAANSRPPRESRLAGAAPHQPQAYDAYLKGRYFFDPPTEQRTCRRAILARFERRSPWGPASARPAQGSSDAFLSTAPTKVPSRPRRPGPSEGRRHRGGCRARRGPGPRRTPRLPTFRLMDQDYSSKSTGATFAAAPSS